MEEEERNRRGVVSLLSTVSSVRETVGDKCASMGESSNFGQPYFCYGHTSH